MVEINQYWNARNAFIYESLLPDLKTKYRMTGLSYGIDFNRLSTQNSQDYLNRDPEWSAAGDEFSRRLAEFDVRWGGLSADWGKLFGITRAPIAGVLNGVAYIVLPAALPEAPATPGPAVDGTFPAADPVAFELPSYEAPAAPSPQEVEEPAQAPATDGAFLLGQGAIGGEASPMPSGRSLIELGLVD